MFPHKIGHKYSIQAQLYLCLHEIYPKNDRVSYMNAKRLTYLIGIKSSLVRSRLMQAAVNMLVFAEYR